MKQSRLIKALKDTLKEGDRKKHKALKDILKKMKKKEVALKEAAVSAESGKDRKAIESKIAVLHEQRKKGVKELRRLKDKA